MFWQKDEVSDAGGTF